MSTDIRDDLDRLSKTVTLNIWIKESCAPIIIPVFVPNFPLFKIKDCPSIYRDILHGNDSIYIATYDPATGQWQYHTADTIRHVHPSQIFLYSVLEDGLNSTRIMNCPGLDAAIASFHSAESLPPKPIMTVQSTSIPVSALTSREWPSDYSVEEIVWGIENMSRTASTTAVRAQSQMFKDSFPDATKFVSSTFRRHRNLYKRALTYAGLVEANSKVKWVDLVSYIEGTNRRNRGVISSPSPVQTASNWTVEGQSDLSWSWEGFDLWNACPSVGNMAHFQGEDGIGEAGDFDSAVLFGL